MTRLQSAHRKPYQLQPKCPRCLQHRGKMCGAICCTCKAEQEFMFDGGHYSRPRVYTAIGRKKAKEKLTKWYRKHGLIAGQIRTHSNTIRIGA